MSHGIHSTNVELDRKAGQTLAAALNALVKAGETPRDLGERLGVSQSKISSLRHPGYVTRLHRDTLIKIAAALGASTDDVIAGKLPPGATP